MANLITRADFEKYVQISELGNDAKTLDVHIVNAQNIDIKQALGNALWTDIEANPTSTNPDYVTLLNGGVYEHDGFDYSFSGLKAAIVMFAMARRRIGSGSIDSPWGMVQKTSEYSQPVSSAVRQQMVDSARSMASAYMDEVLEYLKRKSADYPLFTECKTQRKTGATSFKPVSRI